MGIRSIALEHTRLVLSALSVTSVGLIGTAGYMADALINGAVGISFYAGLEVGAVQLARVLRQADFNDRASCCQEGFRWLWVVWILDLDGFTSYRSHLE